jgi:ribosome-binding factor A
MKPTKPTNTNRIPRVNSLIQQKLGEVLREYLDGEKGLVTITKVDTSKDLRHSKVWISIFGGDDDKIMKAIEKNIFEIQGALNSSMNTKLFPRLSFHLDTSPRYVEHIDELIKKVHEEE